MMLALIKTSIASAFAVLLAAAALAGLFCITVAISDPGWWLRHYESRANAQIFSVLEFAAPLVLVGLAGTFLLKGFYRRHRRFAHVVGSIGSYIVAGIGIITLAIASNPTPPRQLPFLIASLTYGIALVIGWVYLAKKAFRS